jgi:hypothetical protein
MGLRDDIQADIAEAFDTDLADAVQPFAFERVTVGYIDPITGQQTGGGEVSVSGRGVFGSFKESELSSASSSPQGQHVLRTDVKLTALQNEVLSDKGAQVLPEKGDRVVYAGGSMQVVYVGQDPAGASMTVQLRST